MAHQSDLIAQDIHAYLKAQEEKGMVRFITCGSVDDGKSTLIGRLLWDSKMIFEDQLAALEADSRRVGTQGGAIDYALLLDGLQAEREQGITIDVAYRFFSTDKRKFIVADTPGHEQYTRNMVTGASTAQVAIILVDARKGVLTQTKRHSYLVSLVGIRHVVLAVNKMDLVDFSAARFDAIRAEYEAFAAGLGFTEIMALPISALEGDNVLERSVRTPWHAGPTLMEYLETVPVADETQALPFRLPVQWVNRPNLDFRGFAGTVASGSIRPGDEIVVASSGQRSRVRRIVTMDGDLEQAVAGQAVTVTLEDEIDISRGDLLAAPQAPPTRSARWRATLVWLHEQPLTVGRSYLLKCGATVVPARVEAVRHQIDVNTLQQIPAVDLTLNAVGLCELRLDRAIPLDLYRDDRSGGSFILIDRFSNATVSAGMIEAPLIATGEERTAATVVDRSARAALKGQQPQLLWFSGRSDEENAAVARAVESRLHSRGLHTALLDASQGNDAEGEPERQNRAIEAARLLLDAGLIVLVSGAGSLQPLPPQLAEEPLLAVRLAPGEKRQTDDAPPVLTVGGSHGVTELAEQVLQGLDPILAARDVVSPGIIC